MNHLSEHFQESANMKKVILLVLVGPPGSGKTTFCNEVIRTANREWVRICQDVIANGKSGTRAQCLKGATDALNAGKDVFIDRCNLEREQRRDFVNLGGPNIDVHALVLDLPAKLCIFRSVNRNSHEGNLQGGKAAAVVNRMLHKKELPELSEGFSRIRFCNNESDVQDAVSEYNKLRPNDFLPSGCFGQKAHDSNKQRSIMEFMKKVGPHDKVATQNSSNKGTCSANIADEGKTTIQGSLGDGASSSEVPALAFPSISTADFQFNHEVASDIIVEEVEKLLKKNKHLKLVFVDLMLHSHMLSLVRSKALKKDIDHCRFLMVVGDITRLHTVLGLKCNAIANAANWRLKPGGGGVNAAVFSAAGKELEIATRELAQTLDPGKAIAVALPSSSPLYTREHVTHVIHVLGPNMNPQRPNCLNNDYSKGSRILRETYSSLFDAFLTIVANQPLLERESNDGKEKRLSVVHECHGNAECMSLNPGYQKSRHEIYGNFKRGKKLEDIASEVASEALNSSFPDSVINTKKAWASWANALRDIAMHPERYSSVILEVSDETVVLNDLYPKAKKHLLVLARADGLDQLADVGRENLCLLRKMHSLGHSWAEKFISEDSSFFFRIGYHSVPSLQQLHLHIISQDFDSPHLKNKKHWNSFNSDFFRDSVDVIEEVEKHGKAKLYSENLLTMELRCHRCKSAHPSIPRLKSHISICRRPLPSYLQNRLLKERK